MRDNMRNCGAVKKWNCPTCNASAVKIRQRWVIGHERGCTAYEGIEDVGPVTSVNDPDNAYFVPTDTT
jgi:hypothetical protein